MDKCTVMTWLPQVAKDFQRVPGWCMGFCARLVNKISRAIGSEKSRERVQGLFQQRLLARSPFLQPGLDLVSFCIRPGLME